MKEKVKESKKAPPDPGTPADSEVRSQVSKDGAALSRGFILIQQKDCALQKGKVKAFRVLTQKKD